MSKPKNMKVAAIQMCSSATVDENLLMAKALIEEAAHNGAKLVVLPEMFAIMGMDSKDKVQVKENMGVGDIQEFLSQAAKKNKVWIVGGTIPLACDDAEKIRAACIVFNEVGVPVARYDKIHLFDVIIAESETYKESATTQPGENIVVIDTPVGRLGLAVCYDLRFPELFRCMMQQQVDIIAVPSAFTVTTGAAHWELLVRARAIDTFSYVIGACQGGTHSSGRKTYGHSLMVGPWGDIQSQKKDMAPGVIYATIDLAHLKKIRQSIPIHKHQKMFTQ